MIGSYNPAAMERPARPPRPSSDESTSTALLCRARAGDEEARERLYRRLLPILCRWAHGQVPAKARAFLDTDDLVQETLTETLLQVREFEPRQDHGLHLYLRAALRNRIRDALRHAYRGPTALEALHDSMPGDGPSPFDEAAGDETRHRYEAALADLQEAERVMVVARLEFGLSWRDVAALANRPSEDAARVAVGRALVRIAARMGSDRE